MNRNDLRMLTSLVTEERARTGNAEMFDDLVGSQTFLRGTKLLFGNSAKIIVPRTWLRKQVVAFLHCDFISKHAQERTAGE